MAGCGDGEGDSKECEEDGVRTATAESPVTAVDLSGLLLRLAVEDDGGSVLLFVVEVLPALPVNHEHMPFIAGSVSNGFQLLCGDAEEWRQNVPNKTNRSFRGNKSVKAIFWSASSSRNRNIKEKDNRGRRR